MAISFAFRPDAYCEPAGTVCNPRGWFGNTGPTQADTLLRRPSLDLDQSRSAGFARFVGRAD
jgi:hypothetical protein